MSNGKEIRTKIRSVESTQKITKAMQMVAAAKMRKAQERMRTGRPYVEKIRQLAAHLSHANVSDYKHPFLRAMPEKIERVGLILVTTDKGLCGGLNTNIQRAAINAMEHWEHEEGVKEIFSCCIGSRGLGFMQRAGAKVVSQLVQVGDTPSVESLIGPIKVLMDDFVAGKIDVIYLAYSRFVNTMRQDPVIEQLVPLAGDKLGTPENSWDYLYEPDAQLVIDALLLRYVESLVYQAVAENIASEQSARRVAMKAATDNATSIISELQLVYNKTRQAAITKELSEIVGGAAAV